MPEASILHPARTFQRAEPKAIFIRSVATIVAHHMDGHDYGGELLYLSPDHVDVILTSYEQDDVRLGSTFVVRITGYDYPQRMLVIRDILTAISADIEKTLTDLHSLVSLVRNDSMAPRIGIAGQKLVTVTFVPIGEGCWASSGK